MRRLLSFCIYLLCPYLLMSQSVGAGLYQKGLSFSSEKKWSQAREKFDASFQWYIGRDSFEQATEAVYKSARTHLYDGRNMRAMVDRLQDGIRLLTNSGTTAIPSLAKAYTLSGYAQRWLDEYVLALEDYEAAIELFESQQVNRPNVAYAYFMAAQLCIRFMDYPKAIHYLNTALEKDSTQKHQASILGQIANYHYFKGHYSDALSFVQQTRAANPSRLTQATISVIEANIYLQQNKLKQAEAQALQALAYYQSRKPMWEERLKQYLLLAKIAERRMDASEVDRNFRLALEESNAFGSPINRELARVYVQQGAYFERTNQGDRAMRSFQQAMRHIFPSYTDTAYHSLPTTDAIYPESWQMTTAMNKARALKKRFKKTADLNDLKFAGQHFELSMRAAKALYNFYGTEDAKNEIGEYTYDYVEDGIDTYYELYQQRPDPTYLEKIFAFMEGSKAQVLQEAFEQNNAAVLAQIPDSSLYRERVLKNRIVQAHKAYLIFEGGAKERDSLRSVWSQLKNEHGLLLQQLKRQYPSFKSALENGKLTSLKDLQHYLREKQAVLFEYFAGSSYLFILKVSADQVDVYKLADVAEVAAEITTLNSYLQSVDAISKNYDQFQQLAHGLFQKLCPELSLEQKDPPALILVPDGLLHQLTFDALVVQPNTQNPFLVEYFSNWKAYSASHLCSQTTQGDKHKIQAVFLPGFDKGERQLATLRYGQQEVGSLSNAQRFEGPQASMHNFRLYAPQSSLIHLSTHAIGGIAPRIEFIDSTLYLAELYGMRIPSQLVLLSACESNSGALVKGEGIMSLARGFKYAGAQNTIASQWQVNERSTALLFQLFYEELNKGTSIAKALQQAKIQYLRQVPSDMERLPYYWAGFNLIGQDTDLKLHRSKPYTWLWGLLLVGLVALVWRWRQVGH
ncbi:MAG: CHAT domain-containing protein [Bacteroidota bacterium]